MLLVLIKKSVNNSRKSKLRAHKQHEEIKKYANEKKFF